VAGAAVLFLVKRRKGAAEAVKGEVEDVKHAFTAVEEAIDHAIDQSVERIGRQLAADDPEAAPAP
jgi:hypothetical protein